MATEVKCPECGSRRVEPSQVCPTCGAPPIRENELRAQPEEVRGEDLEPYVTLRYIARLFKVLAVGKGVDDPLMGFGQGDRSAAL